MSTLHKSGHQIDSFEPLEKLFGYLAYLNTELYDIQHKLDEEQALELSFSFFEQASYALASHPIYKPRYSAFEVGHIYAFK